MTQSRRVLEAEDRARPLLAYPDGIDAARLSPDSAGALAGICDARVLLGWTPEERPWLASDTVTGYTVIGGYALADAVRAGRLRCLPVRLSAVPRLLEHLRPDVAVVAGVRRGAELAFRGTVGWGPAAARIACAVVVEVDDRADDLGGPVIPGNVVAVVERDDAPIPAPAPRACDDVDLAIGRRVVALLPEGPTLQLGPGGIAEAIVASLDRPVRIWSGLLTDAMASLDARGLLTGTVTAGYTWGGEPIARLARAGRLTLAPVEVTHDVSTVAAIPRFVGCNTALQVGLDGAVNVERVGGRIVAGIGGHADFCAAGSRSAGGFSLIALRAADRSGGSTIVRTVDVVSTPRCDIDIVVTEHGVADLRGRSDEQRAAALIEVAAPAHRDALGASRFSS